MGVLLLVAGALAVASGGFKLRERVRSLFGVSRLAVVEVLVGGLTLAGAGGGIGSVRPLAWALVFMVFASVALSSWALVRRAIADGKRRGASEAERLKDFLES